MHDPVGEVKLFHLCEEEASDALEAKQGDVEPHVGSTDKKVMLTDTLSLCSLYKMDVKQSRYCILYNTQFLQCTISQVVLYGIHLTFVLYLLI